jgi:hypothetical protein
VSARDHPASAPLLASNFRTTAGGVYLDFKTAHPVSGGYLAAAPLGA